MTNEDRKMADDDDDGLGDPRHFAFADAIKSGISVTEAAAKAGIKLVPCGKQPDFYVYFLVDPIVDKVFYVGKGKQDRYKHHESACRNGHADGNIEKQKVIEEIISTGNKPSAYVLQSGLPEDEAYSLERAFIAAIGLSNLTNKTRGQATFTPFSRETKWMALSFLRHRLIRPKEWVATRNPSEHEKLMYVRIVMELLKIAMYGQQSEIVIDQTRRFKPIMGT